MKLTVGSLITTYQVLFRKFYHHSPPSVLLQLYLSLIRPHTEYAAAVWDPHLKGDILAIERLQKFALRVCTKQWSLEYQRLLHLCDLPSLVTRRRYLRLCVLYKLLKNFSIKCFYSKSQLGTTATFYGTVQAFCPYQHVL